MLPWMTVAIAPCFIAVVLYTKRTPFWWIARLMESVDLACHTAWRFGSLALKRWARDTRALLLVRKAEGCL